MASDPIRTYYLQGFADAQEPNRKRMRAVPYNFKLAYATDWWDAKRNRKNIYEGC